MPIVRSFLDIRDSCRIGSQIKSDKFYLDSHQKTVGEYAKLPTRTDLINRLLDSMEGPTKYLEIGVRNPDHNFDHIRADQKLSVDPGFEFAENIADFKMTSDVFFNHLFAGKVLSPDYQFDVVFIDGLHLAEQVDRDISNSLKILKQKGFLVLHDCNPPTEWHARETFECSKTPAGGY